MSAFDKFVYPMLSKQLPSVSLSVAYIRR